MGRALAAFLGGCFMILVALFGRRDVARARAVPRSARMMGDRGTLASIHRPGLGDRLVGRVG
jgi:hypothetical protein